MARSTLGAVVFGDVIASRADAPAATAWLARLAAMLDERYGGERLAPFEFTQGDEIQGLIAVGADPFGAILAASLDDDPWPMRWAVAVGTVDPGSGPATRRTGQAFLAARAALALARDRRDGLLVVTGDPDADRLLDALAPIAAEMLGDLTPRQRVVARLTILDGLRQSEVADRLGVSRATVSVIHTRGRIRSLARMLEAVRSIHRSGVERSSVHAD